jgi:hypothetical protein
MALAAHRDLSTLLEPIAKLVGPVAGAAESASLQSVEIALADWSAAQ